MKYKICKFNLRPLATSCRSVWPGLFKLKVNVSKDQTKSKISGKNAKLFKPRLWVDHVEVFISLHFISLSDNSMFCQQMTRIVLWPDTMKSSCQAVKPWPNDRQVVASGRKLNSRRDLRWVAKRLASFFASTRKSQKKNILRQTFLYFIG